MTTFADRKMARVEKGQQNFKFQVWASFPICGEILGTFSSRKSAEEFALRPVSCFVDDTRAMRSLVERCGRTRMISSGQTFRVERV